MAKLCLKIGWTQLRPVLRPGTIGGILMVPELVSDVQVGDKEDFVVRCEHNICHWLLADLGRLPGVLP